MHAECLRRYYCMPSRPSPVEYKLYLVARGVSEKAFGTEFDSSRLLSKYYMCLPPPLKQQIFPYNTTTSPFVARCPFPPVSPAERNRKVIIMLLDYPGTRVSALRLFHGLQPGAGPGPRPGGHAAWRGRWKVPSTSTISSSFSRSTSIIVRGGYLLASLPQSST
jgi:hypothetical protein